MKIVQDIKNKNTGFTIIEMLMVLAIFAIVSSIVIFNYSSFHSNVSLENLSGDISLTIRRAQSYATGVKGSTLGGTEASAFPGYGIHFSTEPGSSARSFLGSNKSFIFFADLFSGPVSTGSPAYDQSNDSCGYENLEPGNECLEEITINSTDVIDEICTDSSCGKGSVDILFKRPQPDALFCFIPSGDLSCAGTSSFVSIKIRSITDKVQKITIWNTGQISIE